MGDLGNSEMWVAKEDGIGDYETSAWPHGRVCGKFLPVRFLWYCGWRF